MLDARITEILAAIQRTARCAPDLLAMLGTIHEGAERIGGGRARSTPTYCRCHRCDDCCGLSRVPVDVSHALGSGTAVLDSFPPPWAAAPPRPESPTCPNP